MGLLARATGAELERAWQRETPPPSYTLLRTAETGLVMVRGRIGGTGDPFNLGEMTVTRCAIRLAAGSVGLSYLAGRDRRQAELAAVFDALLQDSKRRPALEAELIAPIAERLAETRRVLAATVAPTRVDFFTLARDA